MDQFTDLASVIRLLKRRLLFFIVPVILILPVGVAAVLFWPSIYRSQATILVESQQIPDALVKSTVTAMAEERLQVIQQRTLSRDNLLGLARKFSIFADKPDLSPSELADKVKERILIIPASSDRGGRRGADRLVVTFTVSYEDESPQRAASVANELMTTILSADAKTRASQAAETASFLQEESTRVARALTEIEQKIAQFRLENSAALPEKLNFNLSSSDRLEKNISDVDRELQGIEEQKRLLAFEATVRGAMGGGPVGPNGRSEAEVRIEAVRAEITTKSALYSDNHPEMKALRRTLKALEEEQAGALSTIKPADDGAEVSKISATSVEVQLVQEKLGALNARVQFLKKQREQYLVASDRLKDVIARTPDAGAELAGFERAREATQKSLDSLNEKLAAARLGERLEEDQRSERFEVIEQPIIPAEPFWPDRKKLLALVFGAAMAGGGGTAFAAEFFDRRLRTSAEMVSRLGLRPLAIIEYIPLRREEKNKRWKIIAIATVLLLAIFGALAAVHFLFMPLDLVMLKIMQRLDL